MCISGDICHKFQCKIEWLYRYKTLFVVINSKNWLESRESSRALSPKMRLAKRKLHANERDKKLRGLFGMQNGQNEWRKPSGSG